jgi:hypothetical protein
VVDTGPVDIGSESVGTQDGQTDTSSAEPGQPGQPGHCKPSVSAAGPVSITLRLLLTLPMQLHSAVIPAASAAPCASTIAVAITAVMSSPSVLPLASPTLLCVPLELLLKQLAIPSLPPSPTSMPPCFQRHPTRPRYIERRCRHRRRASHYQRHSQRSSHITSAFTADTAGAFSTRMATGADPAIICCFL